MATITANAGAAGNWNSDSSWIGGVKPTAADDAVIPLATTSITIDAGSVCRSADFDTFTGTITMGSTGTLTIGDGTAGAGNIALRIPSGCTFAPNAASLITFISTSATLQTIDFGGKTMGLITFNASSNGNWALTTNTTVASNTALTLTKGTLHTDGAADNSGLTHSWGQFVLTGSSTRVITLGNSSITVTRAGTDANSPVYLENISGLTITANTATITMTAASSTIKWPNMNWNGTSIVASGSGAFTFNFGSSTTVTCANFTRTGSAAKTDTFVLGGNITCTSTFTCTGNSAINRVLVQSNTIGTARTITAAAVSVNASDFQDITGAGAATWDMSGASNFTGDCGGNSMKSLGSAAFTTAATQTWSGTSGGNWSTNAWTTRVPLPQDDVVISSAFSASQTVTADMPRLGKSISFSGATGSPTFTNSLTTSIYGSLTLISSMTVSLGSNVSFSGRSTPYTITSSGKSISGSVSLNAYGNTYTLQDALISSGYLIINSGTFVSNNFNVTCFAFDCSTSIARGLTMGTSVFAASGTGVINPINFTSSGLTFSGANSTILISSATSSTRTFNGGGLTYGTLTYTVAGSTGQLNITGSNTFTTINFSDASNARTLAFTAGTTTTILNSFNVYGSAAGNVTIGSITASGHTLSKASGIISGRYLTISRSTAGGGAAWYAGATPPSVDNGNNSGWLFSQAPPSGGSGGGGASGVASVANLQNLRSL